MNQNIKPVIVREIGFGWGHIYTSNSNNNGNDNNHNNNDNNNNNNYRNYSRHPSVTNDNGLASPFDKGVFLLKEMRPDKIIRK